MSILEVEVKSFLVGIYLKILIPLAMRQIRRFLNYGLVVNTWTIGVA